MNGMTQWFNACVCMWCTYPLRAANTDLVGFDTDLVGFELPIPMLLLSHMQSSPHFLISFVKK